MNATLVILKRITPFVIRFCLLAGLAVAPACRRTAREGELTMMIEKRVPTFDPRRSSDSAAERMRQLIFNGLTRKNEKFEPVADLAESFQSSPDYQVFTFRLRSGIKFHDGRVFTS